MQVVVSENAVVIRFRPTDPEKLLVTAAREHRRTGVYGLSVFADVPRPGEGEEDVVERLLRASELAGIVKENNPKYYVSSSAQRLLALGYTFEKDGDDDELPQHYSVSLGTSPSVDDTARFVGAFGPARKR